MLGIPKIGYSEKPHADLLERVLALFRLPCQHHVPCQYRLEGPSSHHRRQHNRLCHVLWSRRSLR